MRSRHPIGPQETQSVINKSSPETKNRRCSTLEDFFFSEPDELELLEKSDEIILPRIIDSSIDSTEGVKLISSKKVEDINFIPPKTSSRSSTSSGTQNTQPKTQKDKINENSGQNLKVRYKQPAAPPPSGLGAGNYDEDLPNIPDSDNTISDPGFWNNVQGQETENSEDESQPTEASAPSPPTYELTKESIKENDFLTKNSEPREFNDWEGEKRTIKSKELKKSVFSHGIEAKTSSPEDLVECPIQTDPTKYQRSGCGKITDKNAQEFSNKIVNLAQSKQVGMVKFKTKMPYYDSQMAIGHMNVLTGDCAFFHENGKYWSYKKYSMEEIPDLLANVHSSLKWASNNLSPKSEL